MKREENSAAVSSTASNRPAMPIVPDRGCPCGGRRVLVRLLHGHLYTKTIDLAGRFEAAPDAGAERFSHSRPSSARQQ